MPEEPEVEALGIEDGWLAVMGHNGQCFGFQLSRSKADWDANQRLWERFEQGASPSSLDFRPALSVELLSTETPECRWPRPRCRSTTSTPSPWNHMNARSELNRPPQITSDGLGRRPCGL